MRTRSIAPIKKIRTAPIKKSVFITQRKLFDYDDEVIIANDVAGSKKTALDIAMDMQYDKIPFIRTSNTNIPTYFYYNKTNGIYQRISIDKKGRWIGKSMSLLNNTVDVQADQDDCMRLPSKDQILEIYHFICNFMQFQDDKNMRWHLSAVLYKIENTLRNIYIYEKE